MPVGFPVAPFFGSETLTQPATITPSGGTARDISIIFDRDYEDTSIGDSQVGNERPVAHVREQDVQDIQSGATLVVHDYVTDENDIPVLDDDGGYLIAESIKSYKVTRARRTGDGVAILDLRTD